jgi:hypothetical protein
MFDDSYVTALGTDIRPRQADTTFSEIITKVRTWDAEYSQTESASANDFEITEDALISGKNSIPTDQAARLRLLGMAGAPTSYLANRSIAIQILALREHIRQGQLGDILTPVLRRGQLFTLLSGSLVELSSTEVLTAVGDSLGSNTDGLTMSKVSHADGRLELDLVSPLKTMEIRRGDVVTAGLHIEHSRYSDVATQIYAFVYRLICENGMTRRECASAEGIVRTRKLSANHPRAKELMLDQIRRLTARTWGKLDKQLTEVKATSERRADVPQLLGQWVQRARISPRTANPEKVQTIMDRLLRAWRDEGAESSYYAAVNALTWVASHDLELSARQRRVLSLLGGLLAFSGVHICPRCLSVLAGPAQPRENDPAEAEPAYSGNE